MARAAVEEDGPAEGRERKGSALHAARLPCATCGEETPHRILHLQPLGSGQVLRGTARCQQCRTTHRFETRTPRPVKVHLILSDGPESRTEEHEFPAGTFLKVGEAIPEIEPEARVRRIDRPDGHMAPAAKVEEIGAVWATLHRGAVVPVSIVEGARTVPGRLELPPEHRLTVGDTIEVDGARVYIAALRSRQRNWDAPGDGFPAGRVDRVYARRNRNPPAGRSGWIAERVSPRSSASSTSRSDRSRSSPGSSRTRSSPRARNASGGATETSSSPS
jgi:uncharacterized Zn finger protein